MKLKPLQYRSESLPLKNIKKDTSDRQQESRDFNPVRKSTICLAGLLLVKDCTFLLHFLLVFELDIVVSAIVVEIDSRVFVRKSLILTAMFKIHDGPTADFLVLVFA